MNSGSSTSRDSSSSSQMDQGSSGSGDMNRPGSSTFRNRSQSQDSMGGSRDTISGTDIPNTSGLSDREYVMRLKRTHREALEVAEIQLKEGKSAEAKSMARRTITSQKAEISKLDRWLATQR